MNDNRIMIEEVKEEKDLEIYIRNDLKSSAQCMKSANKARSILGMVRRNLKRLDMDYFLLIYKTYIRPHMELCVQAWSLYLVKDVQCLEIVQQTATKIVPALRNLPYEERLWQLKLTTLEERRCRGDLIKSFKMMTSDKTISQHLFHPSNTGHHFRGHSMKLAVTQYRTEVRRHFLSRRIVPNLSRLTQQVVDETSVNCFKNRLEKKWKDMGI